MEARRGKGVSKEGQEIFDALVKTLPTRWDGTRIVVNDQVLIEAPYRSEDCKASKEQGGALAQVRRVVSLDLHLLYDALCVCSSVKLGNNTIIRSNPARTQLIGFTAYSWKANARKSKQRSETA